ncbi:LacI family DNA-binding transcriptional regulator [Pisciglobus halotolerans]|uniref:Transcriptional regulator, LacI family n=1 Tax=Pisciglobus halotolerans TaxID=745365 RepID=A0A1I3AUK1_9LACT|nr:LacI family DNA-binding transcriptional regulator [Pisciglobus halotolerans]SFH53767.1 transcriptional regulator, LacI family [Pisciglobus halotolerans]
MVGIKDIAKKAGVSISTVSYALNGSSKVTTETRDRIVAIANELNYIPNMAGRNLRRNKTNIIGVYISSYSGTFYGDLLDGIMQKAKQNGYEMVACSGDRSHLFLPQRMIDGAIVLDPAFPDKEILQYAKRGNKIVVLDRKIEHKNICHVLLDNKKGSEQAIQALKETKVKKVYILSGPKETFDSNERLSAALQTLKKLALNVRIIQGDFTKDSGKRAARRIELDWKEPIGIFSLNDEMAIGLYDYFQQSALVIGKDVFVAGFDDILISKYITPALATVSYSKTEWGSISAEKLFQLIHNEETRNTLIETEFIWRESLGESKNKL